MNREDSVRAFARAGVARTAEHVTAGHPDKFCDQVADRILDRSLELTPEGHRHRVRTAIEVLAKDRSVVLAGEVRWPPGVEARLDISKLVRDTWTDIGYDGAETLVVTSLLSHQSSEIASGVDDMVAGDDGGGAGDQGIMVGYATRETETMMPLEYELARNISLMLKELRQNGTLPWLRPDGKSQVSLDADGRAAKVVVAAQHAEEVSPQEVRQEIIARAVLPVVGDISLADITVNGTGRFTIGGPEGDAGVVGRKIVIDAYGPRVPVGGGAYSGKDPTKVDRSAAYMARYIAKQIVSQQIGGAEHCTVQLAYGIGRKEPEQVTAITDAGKDLSTWVKAKFPDLSPGSIRRVLGLWNPKGWSYRDTAAFGHYGRPQFPWEKVA